MERPHRDATIDGLRALAALAVLAYHVAFMCMDPASRGAWLVLSLNDGVPIFFVLSGYLLYRPFAAAREQGRPRPSTRAFAVRRLARIIPAYWVALAFFGLGLREVFTDDWWRYFGLLQIYDERTVLSALGPAWSLCVELSFYAVLPLLARLGGWRPVVLLAALDLGWRAALGPHHGTSADVVLPATGAWFAAGMALAMLAVQAPARPALDAAVQRWSVPWRCWPIALALLLAASSRRPSPLTFVAESGVLEHLAIALGAALLVAPVLHTRPSAWLMPLRCRAAVALGTISYGIYLWHMPLLDEARDLGLHGTWAIGGFDLAVAVLLAAGSRRYVERPLIALAGRRRPGTRRTAAAAAVTEA
jgi:peptidoglycan/LPS O-acetylase OafA/YrhL